VRAGRNIVSRCLVGQLEPFSRHFGDERGALATLATWMMTLFIVRTEHRDTQAIQAKLDELLRTQGDARDELTSIDEKDVEEIEAHRAKERQRG
jgi:low affinity Fe/Cu permease